MIVRLLAGLALALALVCSASAEPRHGHHWKDDGDRHYGERYDRPAPDAWRSFWGGVLGGWIAGKLQSERPDREGDDVEGDLEPWSKAWFAYCTDKYRSFNPRTGRYFGYDGEYHFCK